jgi:hypothetical protein
MKFLIVPVVSILETELNERLKFVPSTDVRIGNGEMS